MPTMYPASGLTGDEGMDFIALECSRSSVLFRPWPRQDIGIDANLEFLNEQNQATGLVALVQSKAGLSYISAGKYYIRADKPHFETWSKYSIPVIGVVYNPERRDARWVDLSQHIRDHPECIESGPYQVEAPAEQLFSEGKLDRLYEVVDSFWAEKVQPTAQQLVNSYLTGRLSDKQESLTLLSSQFRWTPLACFFFHQAFVIENDPAIIQYLVELISYYHPSVMRSLTMRDHHVPPSAARVARRCVRRYGLAEIVKMLSVIDPENGIERGYLGRTIVAQIGAVPHTHARLRRIAKNEGFSGFIRGWAIIVLFLSGDIDHEFYASMLENGDEPFVTDALLWAADQTADSETDEEEESDDNSGLYPTGDNRVQRRLPGFE